MVRRMRLRFEGGWKYRRVQMDLHIQLSMPERLSFSGDCGLMVGVGG